MSFAGAAGALRLLAVQAPDIPIAAAPRPTPVAPPAHPKVRLVGPTVKCCAWCGVVLAGRWPKTRDHVTPKYGLALLQAAGLKPVIRVVDSCRDCNEEKASIPPLIYLHSRQDAARLAKVRRRWNHVAARFAAGGIGNFKPDELKRIIGDLSQPMPPGSLRGVRP